MIKKESPKAKKERKEIYQKPKVTVEVMSMKALYMSSNGWNTGDKLLAIIVS